MTDPVHVLRAAPAVMLVLLAACSAGGDRIGGPARNAEASTSQPSTSQNVIRAGGDEAAETAETAEAATGSDGGDAEGEESAAGAERSWDLTPWTDEQIAAAIVGFTDRQRRVTQEADTERARTGPFWDSKEDGTYVCRVCRLPLYDSKTKFDSGTGWPSYYAPFDPAHVETDVDYKIGYARTEVHCARCKAHLGHIFDDGPEPTGKRHCINGVSLDFVPRGEPLQR